MNIVSLEQLSHGSLAGLVKTNFRVWADAQDAQELELLEVTPPRITSSNGAHGLVNESFALVFRGPSDRVLPQRIYWFESAALGRFELFIVPFSRDPDGTRYQATFNRFLKSD